MGESEGDAGKKEYEEWRQREKNYLEYFDDISSNPLREQEKILAHILEKNAETEYLRKYEMNGAVDVGSFRARLPVSDYDLYKPYVDRIFGGDKSPILSFDPAVEILASSGTSGGDPKLIPVTAEDMELRGLVWSLPRPVLNRAMPGLEKGKVLVFLFTKTPNAMSPGGLPCQPASTSFLKSSCFRQRAFDPSYSLTSPAEVIHSMNTEAVMYCHLLLGLMQREEVLKLQFSFPPIIMRALRILEELLPEFCEDIANGTLSASRVKDEDVRSAVLPMLRKDPELAEFLRREFSKPRSESSMDGILRRLWPNLKILETICSGSMEAYIPAIAKISNNLPISSSTYGSTEGWFGVNMDPLCPPERVSYTLFPSCIYYEFIAISDNTEQKSVAAADEVLDLVSLEEGREYEILVTTVSGLYRYRMGDILKVVGFYNATPSFQYVRRKNIVLSVDVDKTDENDLLAAVRRAAKFLETEEGSRLRDFTATADVSSKPGHYVIFWELQVPPTSAVTSHDEQMLEQCCSLMEASLSFVYRGGRHNKVIGALELRLVREGTFDLLASHAVASGSGVMQYKTPRILNGTKAAALVQILDSRVSQNVFSQETPTYTPGGIRSSLSNLSISSVLPS